MCPKNEVNAPDGDRPVLQTVRRAFGKKVPPTVEEELRNLHGLSKPEQKTVRALAAKAAALEGAGMHSSARRLESQALQTVRRYRRAAQTGPNPLTGA
ncbi:MAG: hypothetical protein WC277_05780 [Bacilli bacterium]